MRIDKNFTEIFHKIYLFTIQRFVDMGKDWRTVRAGTKLFQRSRALA